MKTCSNEIIDQGYVSNSSSSYSNNSFNFPSDSSLCSTPPASPGQDINVKKNDPIHDKEAKSNIKASNKVVNCDIDNDKSNTSLKRVRASTLDEDERKIRILERKRRNRESAERSRQRKLQYYKQLEEENIKLKSENDSLKSTLLKINTTNITNLNEEDKTNSSTNKKKENCDKILAYKSRVAELEKSLAEALKRLHTQEVPSKKQKKMICPTKNGTKNCVEPVIVKGKKHPQQDANENLNDDLFEDLLCLDIKNEEHQDMFNEDANFFENLFNPAQTDDELRLTGTAPRVI